MRQHPVGTVGTMAEGQYISAAYRRNTWPRAFSKYLEQSQLSGAGVTWLAWREQTRLYRAISSLEVIFDRIHPTASAFPLKNEFNLKKMASKPRGKRACSWPNEAT